MPPHVHIPKMYTRMFKVHYLQLPKTGSVQMSTNGKVDSHAEEILCSNEKEQSKNTHITNMTESQIQFEQKKSE